MTTRSLTIQLIGLLLLCLSLVYFIPILQQNVPNIIKNNVYETLKKEGLLWVAVQVEGRDVTLRGNTLDREQHQQAVDLSHSLWFVKKVNNEITPKFIEPYVMNIHWDGKYFSVDGYIQNKQDKQKLRQHFKNSNNQDQLKIGLGAPEHWSELRTLILKHITQLKSASVRMIDKSIYIAGKADTHKQITQLQQALQPFKKYDYHIMTHIISLDETAIICQKRFDELLKDINIRFKIGSAIIDDKSNDLLSKLADTAVFCATSQIIITGYTDNVGDPQKNIELSTQRAKAVKGRLFSNGGIPLERLETIGKGDDQPIDTNETKEGRENNRRIEFLVKEL
jgi:OOP family OmpA-OmpF porin